PANRETMRTDASASDNTLFFMFSIPPIFFGTTSGPNRRYGTLSIAFLGRIARIILPVFLVFLLFSRFAV
ncbi:MAG: hypothetical protein RR807_02345, partial [Oscillospiraceae bacterium]